MNNVIKLNSQKDYTNKTPSLIDYETIINDIIDPIRLSSIDQKIYIGTRLFDDNDYTTIRQKVGAATGCKKIPKNDIIDIVSLIANKHQFNPLKEYFENLPRTHTNHIDSWLIDVCGAEDTEINRIIGRKWLLSAVYRACEPGSYVEGALILLGDQAIGKTWLFENLNPEPKYYCGSNADFDNEQKMALLFQGKFIVELAELASIGMSSMEMVKACLTKTTWNYVPKYSNIEKTLPRQIVFGGSTNDFTGILTDTTGNRRFWCIEANKINQKLFLDIKNNLWSEAYAAYGNGEKCVMNKEELMLLAKSNIKYEQNDPLTDHINEKLNDGMYSSQDRISALEVNRLAKEWEPRAHTRKVAGVMKKLGWKLYNGRDRNYYDRPGTNINGEIKC